MCPCLCSCVLDLCVGFFCSLLDLFPLVLVIYLIIIIFFFFAIELYPHVDARHSPSLPSLQFSTSLFA